MNFASAGFQAVPVVSAVVHAPLPLFRKGRMPLSACRVVTTDTELRPFIVLHGLTFLYINYFNSFDVLAHLHMAASVAVVLSESGI